MNYTEFSNKYDEIYKSNLQKSTWPWSDLVSKVMYVRNRLPERINVLELGCGQGANVEFFRSLGANFHSVEASAHCVALLKEEYPDCADSIRVGNFIDAEYGDVKFDLVVDRASLTCNTSEQIRSCVARLAKNMAEVSFYVGIDWYSVNHDEFRKGHSPSDDRFFRIFEESSALFHPPQMHFSDATHIRELFHGFDILHLEEKTTIHYEMIKSYPRQSSSWNFVAQRKRP